METRRRFLVQAAGGVACAACSRSLTGCANDTEAPPLEGDVILTLADYPDLQAVDGLVELSTDLTGYGYPIFVRNLGDAGFLALSSFCNHESCSVNPAGEGFTCPCHGASFAADGTLLQGPATASLLEFDTESDGVTLAILTN